MPTYDYVCGSCGYEFEQFQTITAKPVRKCPRCGREGVKRLIGVGAGIIFRGSGFYETDYRSESYKKAAENENKSGSDKAKETKSSSTDSKTKASTNDKRKSA
jgi:putative FmdB family regulatory protein